jgi:hypothetical protein
MEGVILAEGPHDCSMRSVGSIRSQQAAGVSSRSDAVYEAPQLGLLELR